MDDNRTMDFMMGEPGSLSPVDVVKQAYRDVWQNLKSYCMAGLGFTVAIMMWVLGIVVVCGVVVAPVFYSETEVLITISAILAGFLYFVFMMFIGFWVAPQYLASLLRALANHNRQGTLLSFNSVWKYNKINRKQVASVHILTQLLIMAGTILCLVPGILFSLATVYALPLVALFEMPPSQAIKASLNEFKSNLGWHVVFLCLAILSVSIVSLIPIIGVLLAQPLLLRMYIGAVENSFGHIPLR